MPQETKVETANKSDEKKSEPEVNGTQNNASEQTSKKINSKWTRKEKIIFSLNMLIAVIACVPLWRFYAKYTRITAANYKHAITRNATGIREIYVEKWLPCYRKELRPAIEQHDQYWILRNYYIGVRTQYDGCAAYVTYCTHGRDLVSFFKQLPQLSESWRGPISATLFTPGDDFYLAISAIRYVRTCLRESKYIWNFVSFHLVLPRAHLPRAFPRLPDKWPNNCSAPAPYAQAAYTDTYAHRLRLPYPVNLLRNIARRASNTYYVLSAEVHYLPNMNAMKWFLDAIWNTLCRLYHVSTESKPVALCHHFYAKKFILTKLHLLPDEFNYPKTQYIMPVFELQPKTKLPLRNDDLDTPIKVGTARLLPEAEHAIFSEPMAPYHDERLLWHSNGWHNRPLLYALCLEGMKSYKLHEEFLVYYANEEDNSSAYNDEATAYTAHAAGYLNASVLKMEYLKLYGSTREAECENCFASGVDCFQF